MHFRALVFLAAVMVALTVPALASAQGASRNLVALGRQQYEDLRYDEAIQTLSAAIIRRGNTPAQELEAYELLGLSYLALNRNDEAEGAFRRVLVLDPSHQLSNDLAPRILEFYAGVRERWEAEGRPGIQQQPSSGQSVPQPQQPVTIEHRSPPQQQRNRPVTLHATLNDPDNRVARLVLAYRTGSRGVFRRIDARQVANGRYEATIPGESVRPPLVEYYFEAVDGSGIPVQARGDALAPLRVAVPEPGGVPWWVFAGGGVLVAAAVVTTVIIVSSQQAPAQLTISVTGGQ